MVRSIRRGSVRVRTLESGREGLCPRVFSVGGCLRGELSLGGLSPRII